jgi:hypothetical protein
MAGADGVFAQVRLAPYREPVDYCLRGRVLDFAEVDDQPGSKSASASNSLSSIGATGKWYFRVAPGRGRGSGKSVAGVVIALNSATRQLLDEMMPGLVAKVENDYRESSSKSTK